MRICKSACLLLCAVLLCTSSTGCVGLVANLIHAGWGNLIPPRFDQLAGRKVAVVCMSGSTSFGNSSAATEIAKLVEKKLVDRVPEITLIDQQEIEDWMDRHNWNQIDYRELGEGVETEFLIAIDLDGFSLHEGQTLYKGRANIGVRVYDIPQNKIVLETEPTEIQYPINGGQHTADTSEEVFRSRFLDVVAARVARQFHSYDVKEDYARDPTFIGM